MTDQKNEKYFVTDDISEKVILVGVSAGDGEDTKESLDELAELARTAGAVVAGMMIQNREAPHPGTYLGKGKIDELSAMIAALEATGVICDDELSPAQMANLEDALGTKVMDRTLLILDIFAQRASTREGKIQVELAQLRYRSTRLVGLGRSLSRLGGGIGTRGPGENKLEMDRRLIRERISHLKKELEEVKRHREVARSQRSKNPIPVAAIVGYTNAGKSTLLNTLTGAHVLEEDKLFATLDPTTRSFTLESGQQILLTDTVGFIRKLPHHLIDAFRSTLEEARYADMIIHVVDASNPQMDTQMHVVYETLRQLDIKDKTVITAFNKMDLVEQDRMMLKDFQADYTVYISARNRETLGTLTDTVEKVLREQKIYVEKIFDYREAGKIASIRKYGQLLEEEYTDQGIRVKAYVPADVYAMLQN
ncbi:MAG TPA: GTPase HflX [Candidatus Scybalocola faecavium]|nr:GTPase HflX [Candidatus Scybalocola faecavium]